MAGSPELIARLTVQSACQPPQPDVPGKSAEITGVTGGCDAPRDRALRAAAAAARARA
jgi:hypothetical protein